MGGSEEEQPFSGIQGNENQDHQESSELSEEDQKDLHTTVEAFVEAAVRDDRRTAESIASTLGFTPDDCQEIIETIRSILLL